MFHLDGLGFVDGFAPFPLCCKYSDEFHSTLDHRTSLMLLSEYKRSTLSGFCIWQYVDVIA
jgi:hypothetical protein